MVDTVIPWADDCTSGRDSRHSRVWLGHLGLLGQGSCAEQVLLLLYSWVEMVVAAVVEPLWVLPGLQIFVVT